MGSFQISLSIINRLDGRLIWPSCRPRIDGEHLVVLAEGLAHVELRTDDVSRCLYVLRSLVRDAFVYFDYAPKCMWDPVDYDSLISNQENMSDTGIQKRNVSQNCLTEYF